MRTMTRRACLGMLGAVGLSGLLPADTIGQKGDRRLLAFGDSVTEGFAASDFATTAYVPTLAAALGIGYTNYGIAGASMFGAPHIRASILTDEILLVSPPSKYEVVVMLVGLNDQILNGTDATAITAFQAGLQTGLLYLTSKRRVPDPHGAKERLLARRGQLATVDDGATVWVGNCLREPTGSYLGAGSDAAVAAYNVAIAATVASVTAQGRRVRLVDASAAYDPVAMGSGDNLHPNDAGHAAIASAFLTAMHT